MTPPADAARNADVRTYADATSRYLGARITIGLRRGTLDDYASYSRVHLLPFFGSQLLSEITVDDIDLFIAEKRREGKATKSILNYVGLLGAIFAYAVKRGWCDTNPVSLIDKPRNPRSLEIRYLTDAELTALLDAVPCDERGALDRVLYLTAAMTGLRRGELLALRWQDVDTTVGVIRVRRSYTRGEFGAPKRDAQAGQSPLLRGCCKRSSITEHRAGGTTITTSSSRIR